MWLAITLLLSENNYYSFLVFPVKPMKEIVIVYRTLSHNDQKFVAESLASTDILKFQKYWLHKRTVESQLLYFQNLMEWKCN